MEVLIVNESPAITVDEVHKIRVALLTQAEVHFNPAWRVRGFGIQQASSLPNPIPRDTWVMHLQDALDVQGALGYHDEGGNEVPYMRIGVQAILQSGGAISEVMSHELLEALADPHIYLTALNSDGSRDYAVEVGDPAQGNAYEVLGVPVADFALPSWFDPNTGPSAKTSWTGACIGPFAIASQGYMSYIDTADFSAGWVEVWGAERETPPPVDLDERHARRLNSGPGQRDVPAPEATDQQGQGPGVAAEQPLDEDEV